MRTITEQVYSAAELQEHHPRGFASALARHAKWVYDDPAWAGEHRQSLQAALDAIGSDLPNIEGARRVMAWAENCVFGPLRIPFCKVSLRKSRMRFGAGYRPGEVEPCPWTGFCADEDLLDVIRESARDGDSPKGIVRRVKSRADQLWDDEVESQTSAEYFIDSADANGMEFRADGTIA